MAESINTTPPQNSLREEIIATAVDLFLNLGAKGMTMDDIASSLGVSKKTVYAHFPTKKNLIEVCTQKLSNEIEARIHAILDKKLNPVDEMIEIHLYLMEYLKIKNSSPLSQLRKYYPEIKQKVDKTRSDIMRHSLVCNLRRGIDRGIYREDLDLELTFDYYKILMDGIYDQKHAFSSNRPVSEVIKNFLVYHFQAISTPLGLQKMNEHTNTLSL